ncbi:unnamed protein product [Cyprideis torosa]|uniref:Uncharacterized protein n=1 Tax=Cyprideis torosa TaxID=163714 RepID=A0A7R8W049_9CRUS|nr:unnamed protein product [Cyprideis torosa]CAG0879347.1 unnamed protein product [Cyprideis torosa]
MPSSEQFCLRWNNHQSTLASVFSDLLENTELTDVTLSAEGQTLHAHRLVLAACSPYFKEIFDKCSDRSPILIIKGAKFEELKALVSFMYCGEINVEQEDLVSLLSTAESLSIKGLADNSVKHAAPVPPTPPATTSSTPSQPPMPPLTTLSPAPSAAGINHAFFRRFTELVNQNPIAAAAAAFNHHAVPPFVDGPTPPPAHSSSIAPLRPDPSTPPPVIAGANKRKRRPLSPHLFSGPQNLSDHNRSHSPSSPAPSVKILKEERALSPLVSHPSPEANNNVPTIMNNNKLTLVPSRSSSGMTDELPLSSGEEHSSAGSVGGGRGSHEEAGLKSGDEDMEEEEEEDDVVEEEMRKRGITRSMEDLLDRQWPDEDDEGYQENRGSKPEIKQEDLKPGPGLALRHHLTVVHNAVDSWSFPSRSSNDARITSFG